MNEVDITYYISHITYEAKAKDWNNNPNEWNHAPIAIEELLIVLAIPDLKVYAWCRCKRVANDGSEAHYHWNGLVHFSSRKLRSWKRQARRVDIKSSSVKSAFMKIKCLNHVVGVLRCMACKDSGRDGCRDRDGLVSHPHRHYVRQPIDVRHETRYLKI